MTAFTSLPQQLQRRAASQPDAVLLHHRGRDWSYAEVCARAVSLAGWLRARGVQPGHRVTLALANSVEYVVGYFAIQMSGASAVTLDALQAGGELAYAMNHSGSTAAILSPAVYQRLARAAAQLPTLRTVVLTEASTAVLPGIDAVVFAEATTHAAGDGPVIALESPAQIIYTSGTTGRPKGVVLSHHNLAANTAAIIDSLSLTERDSVFAILAFSYSYGNSLLLTHVSCGGRIVIASDFVFWNDVLDVMHQQATSGFAGIPSSFAMLVNRSDFLRRPWPDLRYLTCAGGALPLSVIERIRQSLPRVELLLMYGQTEASARLSCLPAPDLERKLGSAGLPIRGVEIRIESESGDTMGAGQLGEVVATGDNVMLGYFNDPAATARTLRGGALHTGDLGHLDEEGYLFITGRSDDVLKSGGYRIGPQEIEDAALEVEGVAEVGVTGIPDPTLGAVPVAFVVPTQDDATLVRRIRVHLESVLARYKIPREIHLVPKLPRTSNGKLQRRLLVELIPSRNATPASRD